MDAGCCDPTAQRLLLNAFPLAVADTTSLANMCKILTSPRVPEIDPADALPLAVSNIVN